MINREIDLALLDLGATLDSLDKIITLLSTHDDDVLCVRPCLQVANAQLDHLVELFGSQMKP